MQHPGSAIPRARNTRLVLAATSPAVQSGASPRFADSVGAAFTGRLTARLTPDFANRSLFDHEYDHYPAMTLLEGARQLSLLSAFWRGRRLARTHVLGMDAVFHRFAELDAPVTLAAPHERYEA